MSKPKNRNLFKANLSKPVILICVFIHIHLMAFGQVRMITINPMQTDPRIKTFIADSHRIYTNDQVSKRADLLIYLPASFYLTNSASLYCATAADAGYRVISLAYPGTDKMDFTCQHSTDPACYENFHREITEGKNYSNNIIVDSLEGVFYRLKALLIHLNKTQPSQGWNEYLENNELKQSAIIWSGHSDAAGHVAVIAKYNSIKRAVCFSGPMDFSLHYYLPPAWLGSGVWKTDKSNIYVFGHISDEYTFQKEIWDSLGMSKYGKNININQNSYPYINSHTLVTSTSIAIGDVHECTILDSKTPMDKNKPQYESVWKYLLNIALATSPTLYLNKAIIKLHPNPVRSGAELYFDTNKVLSEFDIYSAFGQKVFSGRINKGVIHLPSLKNGNYFIKIENEHKAVVNKIIVLE